MRKLSEWIEKKGLRKWFQRDNLIILILSGVLLMIIAWPMDQKKEKEEGSEERSGEKTEEETEEETEVFSSETNRESELDRYVASLEDRLESLLSRMEGVGEVRVMITLRSSQELVLEKDQPVTRSETTEKDAEGGSRSVYESENGETTVYASDGSKQSPYVVKTLTPRVEGVVVMAQGAGTARVSSDISEAVQALFGIDAHKVKVIRMKNE